MRNEYHNCLIYLSKDHVDKSKMPIVVKDNIAVKDMPMTCASNALKNFVPKTDAKVVARLRDQGASFVGKANMDEFAMGCDGKTSVFGAVTNPYDITRTAGGSSGGSAAAVAQGLCIAALGTDTGGSVRQPASYCGVAGFKPTHGTVSAEGVVPVAQSLEQVGIFAKNVSTIAEIFTTISDIDVQNLGICNLKGKKIGTVKQFSAVKMDDTAREGFFEATQFFVSQGAEIVEIDMPDLENMLGLYMILSCSEAAENMEKFDCSLCGDELKKRVLFGKFLQQNKSIIKSAQKMREKFVSAVRKTFSLCDAIISPATPTVAFKLEGEQDPMQKKQSDIFLTLANIAGLPAISVPCKCEGLPVGLQIMANNFCDREVLELALAFEQRK